MNTLCLCESSGVAVVTAEYGLRVCVWGGGGGGGGVGLCVCTQRDFRREVSWPLLIGPDKRMFDW